MSTSNGLPDRNMANDHYPLPMEKERAIVRLDISYHISQILEAMGIDWENDPNTKGTPNRVAKMFVEELYRGRFHAMPELTLFPNTKKLDQLYTVGPITVHSTCSHHLVPIVGKVWVGVIPGETLMGLSKFSRLAQWVFARPQIQEEATVQLADLLEDNLSPVGMAVVCEAQHFCMCLRGVKDGDTIMKTSVMRGALLEEPATRAEFMALVKG